MPHATPKPIGKLPFDVRVQQSKEALQVSLAVSVVQILDDLLIGRGCHPAIIGARPESHEGKGE
jgi:hypothetical protein